MRAMCSMSLAIASISVGAGLASAETVRHVPPADAEAGTNLELVAEASGTTPVLAAHVRTTGQTQFTTIELVRRDDEHWVAVVPGTAVASPGIDYYLEAGGQPVFASPDWPHSLPVHVTADSERQGRDLVRTKARRSRIHAMGEWVDYGTTKVGSQKFFDRYYRIDGDFMYHLWAYPLEEVRVGYTRLVGQAESQMCPQGATPPCTADAGFKLGGWFELGLAPIEGFHLDGRVIAMANVAGFALGGRGEARLGMIDASHVAIGVEYLADVGTDGFFRLGWGTVPGFPMSATVEISNLPASTRDTGVRLFYDVARDVGSGVRLGLRVGYAARVQTVAGLTGGLGATVDF
jgi:hypothetical protein